MPVRVVESSTPSPSTGATLTHALPPAFSLLSVGQAFSGTQNVSSLQKDEAWKVNVRIQGTDLDHGYLCGTMEALNVPLTDTPVVTFWEGEIVDVKNYTFFTGKWEATQEEDVRHWSKFQAFSPLASQVEADGGGTQLILVNNCNESVWPGILGGAGHAVPEKGGFHLGLGEEVVFTVPNGWSGRIWGRQGCSFDESGRGSCESGDCAGGLRCMGTGGVPPATVVEMTLGTSKSALHYYDVSLVDGFNLPVSMTPVGGGIGCGIAACEVDLNVCCPAMLEVRRGSKVVGCKSACTALKSAKYCCTGEYASPKSCKPTLFAHLFKAICPRAYSFAYDDSSSLRSCRAPRYLITFCPPAK